MELVLVRTYYPVGTNGKLYNGEQLVCSTIELPWKNNAPKVSCIPEGKYEIVKRRSPKFGWHFILQKVPERQLILIHPANDAIKELKGCIATVTEISGPGKGISSRKALEKLKALVYPKLDTKEKIFLIIKS